MLNLNKNKTRIHYYMCVCGTESMQHVLYIVIAAFPIPFREGTSANKQCANDCKIVKKRKKQLSHTKTSNYNNNYYYYQIVQHDENKK